MSQLVLDVSDELERELVHVAGRRGLSAQEYLSAHLEHFLRERLKFEQLLERVAAAEGSSLLDYIEAAPDVEPDENDRLPDDW